MCTQYVRWRGLKLQCIWCYFAMTTNRISIQHIINNTFYQPTITKFIISTSTSFQLGLIYSTVCQLTVANIITLYISTVLYCLSHINWNFLSTLHHLNVRHIICHESWYIIRTVHRHSDSNSNDISPNDIWYTRRWHKAKRQKPERQKPKCDIKPMTI